MLRKLRLDLAARVIAAVAAVALAAVLVSPSRGSQGSCIMPTSGTVSGLTLVNDINACNNSLISVWSGASAPSGPQAGQFWFNTNTNFIQQYDGASWMNVWYVDATNHLVARPIGGGSATVASAATVDLGAVPNAAVTITGTTPISSFGSSAIVGTIHVLTFTGSSGQINHNATSMILPGGTPIFTSPGDIGFAMYLGSGNWRMIGYQPGAQSPMAVAMSIRGNPTLNSFPATDILIQSLPQKVTITGADKLMLADSASSNALKYVRADGLATSIDGVFGAFTTGNGFSCPASVCGLTAARRTLPTTQTLTASSGTYTTPANVLWIEVRTVGAGGGGGGGQNGTGGAAGGNTCWAASGAACSSPIFQANGGAGSGTINGTPGAGGTTSGTGFSNVGMPGTPGGPPGTGWNAIGGTGGASCLDGGGAGSVGTSTASSAAANSGAGGGGGGATNGTLTGGSGNGGAGGGCLRSIINSPAGTYTFAIGGGGAGSGAGSSGSSAGGAAGSGAAGRIEVIEHYGT